MSGTIASLDIDELNAAALERKRVRTPGKHIVLFLLAVTFMLALSGGLIGATRYVASAPSAGIKSAVAGKSAPMEFLVDLSPDASGRISYLKLVAVATADDPKSLTALDASMTEVRERLTFLLRSLSPEDFENDEGMALVKSEMLRRVNFVIAPKAADDIIISDLIIQ